tara:strand:+ start:1497 stop:4655 length:3159 start_codon:yes stop_codon:yes gene_type:complete
MNQSLASFLFNHRSNNTPVSHTRIGNKDLNISGGSFSIHSDNLPEFYKAYYHHIFVEHKNEYLTEKQSGLCIAIDFDFRYAYDINEKQHGDDDKLNLLQMIIDALKNILIFEDGFKFNAFIMEKSTVNRLEEKNITKDGIHILINIQMEHALQEIMREDILPLLPTVLGHLPITNSWDSVFDETITKGTTNWQLYGSRKPDNDAYKLVSFHNITYDINDDILTMDDYDASEFKLTADTFCQLSVQNPNNPRLEINPKVMMRYVAKTQTHKPTTALKRPQQQHEIPDINNKDDLENAVKQMLDNISSDNYAIRQAHEYSQILPAKYYEAGSHLLNRKVAFALKATEERLFLSWIMLRSKADDFDFSSIPSLQDAWTNHFNKTDRVGLSSRSIYYWAKNDANPDDFKKVSSNCIDTFIDISIQTQTDWDIANVIHKVFGGDYVCADNKNKIWYRFEENRWVLDKGTRIRNAISNEIHKLYFVKASVLYDEIANIDTKDENNSQKNEKLKRRHKSIVEMCGKLKKTTDKNNIMKECMDIFHDDKFIKLLDANVNLLACTNGVIDLEKKEFRQGRPDDYITLSTNIDYIPYDEPHLELNEFLRQLFPFDGLRTYMLNHFASTLFGVNKNQTLEIYKGEGSNGKSGIVELMGHTLGDYKKVAPLSLICGERQQTGSTSSEIIRLKGVRYVVMCEPSKNTIINEGKMKEATGGDPVSGRALYCDTEEFIPQFSLAVCTNVNLKVNTIDAGTWRRIKICPFLSTFKDEDKIQLNEDETPVNDLEFVKNKDLKKILPSYAIPFLSLLVKIAFETNGEVHDCELITNESKLYRDSQDPIGRFLRECVIACQGTNTTKTVLSATCKLWFDANHARFSFTMTEVYDRLEKEYDCDSKRFYNLKLIGDTEEEGQDGHSHISREDKFVAEFNDAFKVCIGNDKYYIPSVAITEWAKMKGLQIHISRDINPLLNVRFGLDVKNKAHYKNKKIEGVSTSCWIGLCFKTDYNEEGEKETKKKTAKETKKEAEDRRKIALERYEELGAIEDKTADEEMEYLQLKVRLRL